MKKRMELVLIIFTISFLTSCASMQNSIQNLSNFFTIDNGIVLPKTTSGGIKTYTIDEKGTVKILGQEMINHTHWLYVTCDHWSGCYMRCQGQIGSCKTVAKNSQIQVEYIFSRSGWRK